MIYRVTYLSGGLRVMGYAALPAGLDTTAEAMQQWLRKECGDQELTAEAVACVLPGAADSAKAAMRALSGAAGLGKNAEGRTLGAEDDEAKAADMQEAREFARASDSQAPGAYPVLVYCRGGIGRVGRVRLDWLAEFAAFGWIVLAPCYRGGESGVGHDEFGGADLEDSRVAVRLARAIPWADSGRIAVLGFSRGSINATDAAIAEHASRLVLWGGLSDLAVTYEERIDLRRMLKRVIKGSAYKLPDVYRERSPIDMAKRLDCPVLIMHGTEDAQVDYGHGERMYAELRRLGKPATLTPLQGLGHHMPQETRMRVLAEMFAWLDTPPQKP